MTLLTFLRATFVAWRFRKHLDISGFSRHSRTACGANVQHCTGVCCASLPSLSLSLSFFILFCLCHFSMDVILGMFWCAVYRVAKPRLSWRLTVALLIFFAPVQFNTIRKENKKLWLKPHLSPDHRVFSTALLRRVDWPSGGSPVTPAQ